MKLSVKDIKKCIYHYMYRCIHVFCFTSTFQLYILLTLLFLIPICSEFNSASYIYVIEKYQLDMMKSLRQVNVDHYHVGWYQSSDVGNFLSLPLLESQFHYQTSIEESVVLIFGKCYCYLLSINISNNKSCSHFELLSYKNLPLKKSL